MAEHQSNDVVLSLRYQIRSLEEQLRILKHTLAKEEQLASKLASQPSKTQPRQTRWPLKPDEYKRYGRQIILPQIGPAGQVKLKNAKVLVVGLGGLGCPAALYLAGAGCGTIGLVDGDQVELSNLHRQVLHTTARTGQCKVESARSSLCELNPNVQCITYPEHLTSTSAIDIILAYDLVLDCTDHPTSRYLISDAAVLAGKPLISASALQTEGQLMVLNNPPAKSNGSPSGPCYRCVFPKPPPPESITTCGDGGILGPVVGVMGVLMALEAMKIMTAACDSRVLQSGRATDVASVSSTMLLFSAFDQPPFRSVRLRGRRLNCAACSANPSITIDSLRSDSLDYVQFCGRVNPVTILLPEERIAAQELNLYMREDGYPIVVDVRDAVQFEICHLEKSINIPFSSISLMGSGVNVWHEYSNVVEDTALQKISDVVQSYPRDTPICFICRFGNDSQLAVRKFKELNHPTLVTRSLHDIRGGFQAWRREVDCTWPDY